MINASDLQWNRFVSLKNDHDFVRKLNAADCEWQKTLEDLRSGGNEKRVVVAGVQNSGKSTLCNLLVQDYDNKTFEVGDREVTREVKSVKSGESGALIVDTPGFGTNAAQNIAFEQIWSRADVLLYATSVLTGSMSDDKNIKNNLLKIISQNPGLKDRISIVCTKMSDNPEAEKIAAQNRKITTELFGPDVPVFLVDSKWYHDGVVDKEEGLVEASNMQPFFKWLNSRMALPSRREEIFRSAKVKWLNNLAEAKKLVERSSANIAKDQKKLSEKLEGVWSKGRDIVKLAWDRCRDSRVKLADLNKKLNELKGR